MLAPIIEEKKEEIAALCRKHRVERLDLFGSATSDKFDIQTSDIDLIVLFADESSGILYRFVDLADDLEQMFQRPVDLLTERSIGSPGFRSRVNESRVTIYERENDRAAA